MYNFKEKMSTLLGNDSPVMKNREKIQIDDIIRDYPEGITIREIDIIPGNPDYIVCRFDENPRAYFFGGKALNEAFFTMLKDFGGDLSDLNSELANTFGLRCKPKKIKTKSGKPFTVWSIN